MNKKPQHAPLTQFPIVNDELVIADIALSTLADTVGSTPFYAYDSNAITQRIKQLGKILPQQIKLHYAIKANPYPPLVRHVAAITDGLDVASGSELAIALETGTAAKNISFAGPGKSTQDLTAALESGITLNIESQGELKRILALAEQTGQQPKIAIRVNPDFELKSSGMKMGGGAKPFGIDAEKVPALLQEMSAMDIAFRGLHIFSGSQNLRSNALIEAQNATFELALRLAEQAPSALQTLNIGGGFGIPYFPGEQALDLAPVADNLQSLVNNCQQQLPDAEIIMELGRYLVGEAGVYVCKVVDKKVSRGQTYLVVDGGLHQHLAASGNFGQIIRKNYPVVIGNHVFNGDRETVNIVGPLCTPLDILADKMDMATAEPGDLVVVLQSGAYGYTASPLQFLGHPAPQEIML